MSRFMLYLLACIFCGYGLVDVGAIYIYGTTISGVSFADNRIVFYLINWFCFSAICIGLLLVIASMNVNTAKWALYLMAFILFCSTLFLLNGLIYMLFQCQVNIFTPPYPTSAPAIGKYGTKLVCIWNNKLFNYAMIASPILFILTLIGVFDARKRA